MTISFYVVVVSDQVFKGKKNDISGEKACEAIASKGYVVKDKIIVPNKFREVIRTIYRLKDADVIVFIGGTGLGPRDLTIDVIESIAWRKIPGFGEFFRLKSYEEIGYRGLLSRAEAYVLGDGRVVVVLPGSPNAVSLGLEIFLNMVEHLVEETRRFEGPHK